MKRTSKEFLTKLLSAPGPSGFEQPVQAVFRQYVTPYCDETLPDLHGNVAAVKKGMGGGHTIMLSGHCDEVGLMVVEADSDGYLYVAAIGGLLPWLLPGLKLDIHTARGVVKGVVGSKPVHLVPQAERDKPISGMDKLWVDIGARSRDEALEAVSLGDPATYGAGVEMLRNNRLCSKSCDDRVGVFVVAEALRLLAKDRLASDVAAVSSVQEEVGLRGATTAAYNVHPDIGIAVDVTQCSDVPGVDSKSIGRAVMGGGPVVARGANINPRVFEVMMKAAQEEGIAVQVRGAPRGTGTDANAIQLSRGGVATGLVSIPNRYMHTPVEVVSLDDLEGAARLVAAFVRLADRTESFLP